MMMIEDTEEFEENFYEELEARYLQRHTLEELETLCKEEDEEFCLACSKNQEEVHR